jgi:hypothetical protein
MVRSTELKGLRYKTHVDIRIFSKDTKNGGLLVRDVSDIVHYNNELKRLVDEIETIIYPYINNIDAMKADDV